MLCCIIPVGTLPVSAEEAEQYIDLQDTPENIQALFEDAGDVSELRILESEDTNSIVVEDAQGNGTVKVFGAPVRYTDDNGETQFIDTSMADENVVSSVFSGYDHQSKIGKTAFKFSKKPDKGVRVDKAFRLAVYNPDKNKFPKGYSETLEDGSGRMVYPEAFGEHTYIEYININTGLKENIVLEKNIGKNRFEFVFDSKEYIPVLSEDASFVTIVHRDNPDEVKYTFTPLYVYDSFKSDEIVETDEEPSKVRVYRNEQQTAQTDETVSQEQTVRHFTEDNYYEIAQLEDGTYRITSVVSQDFLNDPNTVYPVIIDPTFGATNSNAQDSYVWASSPSTNYGSLDYLRFGKKDGGEMSAFFKFTTLPDIPDHANITDATLKFTFRAGQTSGANGVCYMVNTLWSESSVTWNNRPYGEWGYASSHHNYQYYNFYVRPFLEMWYYGGYAFLGVEFTYETMINDYNSVVSSEGTASMAPTLTYTYTAAPTVSANTDYSGNLGLGSSLWYKFTPTVTGTYVIYAKGNTSTYGAIYQNGGWLTDNSYAGPDGNFQITYDLTAGTTYYIKVSGNTYEDTGTFKLHILGKKAIIIVPGVMGTELELAENVGNYASGTLVWPPYGGEDGIATDILDKLDLLSCDTDGEPVYNLRVRSSDTDGAWEEYSSIYSNISTRYGATHEIVFFGYDWRRSNVETAEELKNKISQYSDVVLIAHSMGGLVASNVLVNSTARSRVDKTIILGTPFLGSLDMMPLFSYGYFETAESVLDDVGNGFFAEHPILKDLLLSNLVLPKLQELAINIPSLYELLPNDRYFSLGNRTCLTVNQSTTTTVCTSGYQLGQCLQEIVEDFNMTLYNNAQSANNHPWTTGSTHITTYDDTYYIIGEGQYTIQSFGYTKVDFVTDEYILDYDTAGDGTVSSYSASMNDLYSDKTFFCTSSHAGLTRSSAVFSFINNIIAGSSTQPAGIRSNPSISL